MEEDKEYSLNILHKCSYRFLQQTAKLLNLPCNVKKIHLINLIHTKKHKGPQELELLIKEVKLERLHKRRPNSPPNALQNNEIPISENANQSPPISQTPARQGQVSVVCNPDIAYYRNSSTLKTYPPQQNLKCDRVLRSSSLRAKNVNASNLLKEELKSPVNLNSGREAFNTINKNKNFTSVIEGRRQYARTVAEMRIQYNQSLLNKSPVSKRYRKLSGITPLNEATKQLENRVNYKYVHNLTIRSPNGTYSTIKALVQKPAPCSHADKAIRLRLPELPPLTSTESVDKNNNQNCKNAERYPNLSSGVNNDKYVHVSKVHNKCETIQYYRKKTRAEYVNNLRFNNENGNSDNLPKGTVSLLRVNASVANVTEGHTNNNIIQYNDRASRNIGPRKDNQINNANNELNKENGYISRNYVFPSKNESISMDHEYARNGIIPNANEYPRCNTNVPENHEKNNRSILRNNIIPNNDGVHRNNASIPIIRGSKNGQISKINPLLPSYDELPTNNSIIPINYNNAKNNKKNPRTNGFFPRNHELSRNNGSVSMCQEYARISETFPRIKDVNNNGHLWNDSSLHMNYESAKKSGTSSRFDGIMSITSNDVFPRNNKNIHMNRGNARNSGTIPRINSVIPRNYEFPGDSGSFPLNHEHARYNIPIHKELLSRNNGNMTINNGCAQDYARIRKDREYARVPGIIPITNGDHRTNRNISINYDYATNRDYISNINNFPRDYSNMHMDHDYARKYGVTPSNNVCTPINGSMNMINSISKINETSHDYFLNDDYPINVKYYPLDNGYSRNENTRNSAYSSRNHECSRNDRTTEGLPRISSVFSKFNKVNYSNPLYMNVNENNPPPIPHFAPTPQNSPLEVIYNYKKQCIIDDPIVYPVTVAALTESIYSRSVVMTACVQASAYEQSDNVYRPPQHSQNTTNIEPERFERTQTLIEDIESLPDELVPESCDTTPVSATPAEYYEVPHNTIPDMVEDAMEIISQDGDYLERCGIDVRMQCILCSWAGAKITLEHHIRRTHSAAISMHALGACSATYCLRSVPRAPRVSSRVLDMRGVLLALSVSICAPTGFRASLAMITHETEAKVASITVYNKLTGEPYTWHGVVQQLTENFPFDIESCLDIDLRKTNQIPSNCNMDEINKQLDITSPTQVFFGPPDSVTDISITLLIKVF